MSRAYRVRVTESITETVRAEDGVCASLEMLPILAKERMGDLLGAELERRGFRREGGTATRTDPDGTEISVDLATAQVTVKAAGSKEVRKTVDREVVADQDTGGPGRRAAEEHVRQGARAELQQDAARERAKLSAEVTKQLERKVVDLRRELDQAVNRVTADALKEKASSLGHIEEMTEDPNGGMTIKVRL